MSIVAYARVSTSGQSLDVQLDQLKAAGAEEVFQETRSGSTTEGESNLRLPYASFGKVTCFSSPDWTDWRGP